MGGLMPARTARKLAWVSASHPCSRSQQPLPSAIDKSVKRLSETTVLKKETRARSRHRDGVELHYGRDDFADADRLVRTLSRDRAKDMASNYERADPVHAERRGITFRERVVEIVRKVVPQKVFDGLRSPEDVASPAGGRRPESRLVVSLLGDR